VALLHEPTCSRFDTIPECDRHTDTHTQTHNDGIYRAEHSCRAVKITANKFHQVAWFSNTRATGCLVSGNDDDYKHYTGLEATVAQPIRRRVLTPKSEEPHGLYKWIWSFPYKCCL